MDLDSDGTYTIFDKRNKQIGQVKSNVRGDTEHLANFLDAIRNDKPESLNAEIEKGHKSTLLCHLGNIAQRTGHTLTTKSMNGHIVGDEMAAALWTREYEKGWEPKV